MTYQDSDLGWPWSEFPEDTSTWNSCVKRFAELLSERCQNCGGSIWYRIPNSTWVECANDNCGNRQFH
jgi:hypothetical protein